MILIRLYQNCRVNNVPHETCHISSRPFSHYKIIMSSEESIIRVHFGEHGTTWVPIESAVTIKEALAKPMRMRSLVPEMCGAFICRGISKTPLSWETNISKIKKQEIYVEQIGFWPIKMSHSFEKRNLLSWDHCTGCKKRIIGGFICKNCNCTFHQQCADSIPKLCEQAEVLYAGNSMSSTEYMDMLDTTPDVSVVDPDPWQIAAKDITFSSDCIGMGSFGKVYKGYWNGPVAVKILKKTDPSQGQISDFKNEIALLKITRHPNVLLFMGCAIFGEQNLGIVTEWCEGSSLYNHIHVKETNFEMSSIINIAIQTSQGMNYLHDKNIIHRDLKSNNIFLYDEKSFVVKIGDFGLATIKANINKQRSVYHPEGSILWMAPEIIVCKTADSFGFKSDVYAFGIVLYELLSKQLPYSEGGYRVDEEKCGPKLLSAMQIMWLVGTGKLVPNIASLRIDTPHGLRSLLKNCIKFAAKERPDFSNVLSTLTEATSKLPKTNRPLSEPIITVTLNGQFCKTMDVC